MMKQLQTTKIIDMDEDYYLKPYKNVLDKCLKFLKGHCNPSCTIDHVDFQRYLKKINWQSYCCKHVQFDSPNFKIHQFWVKHIWNIFRYIEDLERISSRLGPVIPTPLKKINGKTKLFNSPAPNKNVAEHKPETATNSEEKDE